MGTMFIQQSKGYVRQIEAGIEKAAATARAGAW
jgi:hypothetical protein